MVCPGTGPAADGDAMPALLANVTVREPVERDEIGQLCSSHRRMEAMGKGGRVKATEHASIGWCGGEVVSPRQSEIDG